LYVSTTIFLAVVIMRSLRTRCTSHPWLLNVAELSTSHVSQLNSHCYVIKSMAALLSNGFRQGHSFSLFINLDFCSCYLFLSYPRRPTLQRRWEHTINMLRSQSTGMTGRVVW
jgi:hypothetical protein